MMRAVAASPSGSRAVAALAALAVIVAMALLAIVLAWWGWRWFGPAATRFVPAGPQEPALALLASGLLAAPAGLPAVADTSARAAPGEARLLGVLAEEGGKGYGLFRLPAGPKLVAAGRGIFSRARPPSGRPQCPPARAARGAPPPPPPGAPG